MLRIAIPNKGALAEHAVDLLQAAGYVGRRDTKTLYILDTRNEVEFFYLRPRDIATYVGAGALDVGITGRDLLIDSGSEALEVGPLNFGNSTFRFAGPPGQFKEIQDLEGKRVATSYIGLVEGFLAAQGVSANLVKLDGAVESAVQLGVADAVADVVDTGSTLKAAGLELFGPVALESTAVLISSPTAASDGVHHFLRRLQSVLVAREYVLMDYDLPAALVDQATAITPGFESPTISPLRDADWVAVRVMVPRRDHNQIMDRLEALGARGILVTPIHSARM